MTDVEKDDLSREEPQAEIKVEGDAVPLTEAEAKAAGLTPDQSQFAMLPLAEAQMLTQIAMLMVEAGVMMSNPPRIVSAETQRFHEQVNELINRAGALSIEWAAAKGIVKLEVQQKPGIISPNGNAG